MEETERQRERARDSPAASKRRMEAALRDSEQRYRFLHEENPSMYFTVDTAGTVRSVNPFGAQQLGYIVEDLVGQPVLQVPCTARSDS